MPKFQVCLNRFSVERISDTASKVKAVFFHKKLHFFLSWPGASPEKYFITSELSKFE